MKRYFSLPRVEGQASRQAHADLPAGTYEREIGKEGFFGPATHLYHRHPPTAWSGFEGPLRPRAFDCAALAASQPSPWQASELLHNAAVRVRFWRLGAPMPALARNADGDDLLFVHEGGGRLFCDYGHLEIGAGDYLVIPRGTMWRIEPSTPIAALLVEATGSGYQLPDRGLLGPHAIFDPAVLETPHVDAAFLAQQHPAREWRVEVKRRNALSVITYPFNPLDAVGWHGDLAVLRLNLRDIRPVMSHRYHLPPSAHSTFVAERFVVCSFVPRPFETDPGALKVPFFHSNDDFDELIFYHAGSFFSRDDIRPGMATLHPAGFTHGPHPKALRNMLTQAKDGTDEYAVMIDTRDPLEVGAAATAIERATYVDSWRAAPEAGAATSPAR
jgi:homogentisate 1,2-dioxygenase